MKRFNLLLFITILTAGICGLAQPADENQNPWELLQNSNMLTNLKVNNAPPSNEPVKPFRLDMTPIKQELEKFAIKEEVKIELRTEAQKMLANLGKYKPVLQKDGKDGVFFDSIPDFKDIYLLADQADRRSDMPLDNVGATPQMPEKGYLIIQGSKKNKAKLLVTFTLLSKTP
ncbi:MAG: hypothetical protein NT166_01155 [Candidatus Aminicenantes bacterium]|nr:hypothetical protein [Candidatus Aminicenantes bacterium]